MKKFNKHIIIVGTARSGTSWLSETIARQHRYRMLFEPEQETRTKQGYLICDKWIENKEEASEAHNYLLRLFSNRVDCDWIAQNSNRRFKRHLWPFIPKKFIIKFVRANLSAKYMNETFKIPVIHIIRNPYDVIKSQQNVKFPWLYDLSHFAKQEKLVSFIQKTFNFDISVYSQYTAIELLAIRWCIENVIPLEYLESYKQKATLIRYEDLYSDIDVFLKLCRDFDIQPIENINGLYRQPSTKTTSSGIQMQKKTKSEWASEDKSAITEILKVFQTKLYPLQN